MDKDNLKKLVLKKAVSDIKVNEGSELTPIELKKLIKSPVKEPLEFAANLADGNALPAGMECSVDGFFSGIPEQGTSSETPYKVIVVARSPSVTPLAFTFHLHILEALLPEEAEASEESDKEAEEGYQELKALEREQDAEIQEEMIAAEEASAEEDAAEEPISDEEQSYADKETMQANLEKLAKFWESFSEQLELPDLNEILGRQASPLDIYHLMGRFASMVVWNADDLTPATVGREIKLAKASDRYRVYDFKVALVMTPKDLFDSVRTLGDGVQTVKAIIEEVKRREWNIELAGYDKLVTAMWVEVQQTNRIGKGHYVEIRNYEPGQPELDALAIQLNVKASKSSAA